LKHKDLVGSGDKIILFTSPFLVIGLILNIKYPSVFEVGGPPPLLRTISLVISVLGIAVWLWSVVLIVTKAARGELITTGPFALVKHPIYTGVSLSVLPWVGFLFNTWLGVLAGIAMYVGSRRFSPEEEKALSQTFGAAWDDYRSKVKFPWL
jgi:protein-S-isoprenylcysteine O-methyltransferase Ste14